jgi:nucleoside-diphosphate-sugar epimerase
LDENSPYKPNPNPYSQSKAKAEQYVLGMCNRGLNAVVVRPAFVYGIGSSYGLNLLIGLVVRRKLKVVIGRGDNYIHPIHVKDLVKALVLVMEKAKTGEIYIVANEKPIKLKEFLNLVASYAGVRLRYGLPPKLAYPILKLKGGIGGSSPKETISLFTKNWFYRIEKLKSLGWKQEIKIEDGIRETVEWITKGNFDDG